jgi:GNAT superfamily N-acetyltransferase
VGGTVRRGTVDDLAGVADALADAFTGYVWDRWTVAADRHTERLTAIQAALVGDLVLPYGELWLVELGGVAVGAAAWFRPDVTVPASAGASVDRRLDHLAGDRAAAAREAESVCRPLRPTTPHYFLAALGVRERARGRGLGSALLRPVLREADEAGVPAYLETSTPRNVRFYERAGFSVTGEAEVPGGGPHVWAMLRSR